MENKYIIKGRDRDTDKQWTALGILEDGQVVGSVSNAILDSGYCYVKMYRGEKTHQRNFKQYLLDNFQANLDPVTQRFYFKTHSQKQLTKIINLKEKVIPTNRRFINKEK